MEPPSPAYSGMGFWLPEAAARVITGLRQRFDLTAGVFDPHISLAYPPFVSPAQWPQVRAIVLDCVRAVQPFEVVLQDLDYFRGNPHVLWFKPDETGQLSHLRALLEARLPAYVPPLPFPFIPHVTFGLLFSEDRVQKVQSEVGALLHGPLGPVRFNLNEACYLFQTAVGAWSIHERLPLGVEDASLSPASLAAQQAQAVADGRVCVVSGLVRSPAGKIFIQRRTPGRRLFPGAWDILGGHVEPGETLFTALAREIWEESGWELVRLLKPVETFDWQEPGEGASPKREFNFLVEVRGDLERPRLEEDKFSEFRWVGLEDLRIVKENRPPGDEMIFRLVKAALSI